MAVGLFGLATIVFGLRRPAGLTLDQRGLKVKRVEPRLLLLQQAQASA
ncbi:hypothetical protein HPGCJGGD_0952 [Methylobacterium haplocladii]|nr:hypothetical protein HPGCJGGD_0952 [Methylobacterium haplocladii]